MEYYENILGLVGHTPLVKLNRMIDPGMATIYAKLEQFNPTGSVKDRI
ncbi:MAG: pyridoxal-phosphate dependent enzyme, partial [Acidiferrobacterales bacterium]